MRGRDFNSLGSLSGHASSMISSLKNNLRRKGLEHFKPFKKKIIYEIGKIEKKATPQQLKEIRDRLQKENKRNRRITIIWIVSFTIILSILLIIFNFVKF